MGGKGDGKGDGNGDGTGDGKRFGKGRCESGMGKGDVKGGW